MLKAVLFSVLISGTSGDHSILCEFVPVTSVDEILMSYTRTYFESNTLSLNVNDIKYFYIVREISVNDKITNGCDFSCELFTEGCSELLDLPGLEV